MKWIKKIPMFVLSAVIAQGIIPAYVSAENKLSEDTINFYNQWKQKYLVQDNYVTNETQYYVYYSEEKYQGGNTSVAVTVSEAHGYGMLITASMADYDENAKEYFDGMYRYFKAHPSDIGANLMSWQQCDNGTELIDGAEEGNMTGGSCDSATDGDMDIAYALLMADSVWGSDGDIDYYSEALAVIDDIMKYDINHEYWTINLGDWVSECDKTENYYSATRCSDFIVQYLPVFAEVSGDDNWLKVYDTTYGIINSIVEKYKTGILPDFVIRNSSGEYVPAPADFLESENDGNYYYNSCRVPWRISMDYLINGNENALSFAESIDNFMMTTTGGDPWEVLAGYTPDGKAIEDYNDLCFVAPLLISAKCGKNTQWHDNIREVLIDYGEDVYYGDTIKMLCLIVDDDGWIVPEKSIKGDVNNDGKFNVADLVTMQKYILSGGDMPDWKAGDLVKDSRIDIFDLCAMRREFLKNMK
ncbi:MAG: glycosyl hydrolase family 8 [Prevotella sp.]|nr:glycosyl hydrolase family 8 [Alistipes senegalensis]MCM1358794.1 glycosyl hydrolase family 8 [Prevotella sp.]MCM1474467.1 glycosyl hydrolase family 8 [Muribaculaceae bacterium]